MDISRFPQGIVIDGSLLIARPVGAIVYDSTSNSFYRSTNAAVATYAFIGVGALGNPIVRIADPGTGNPIPVTASVAISFAIAAVGETNSVAIPTFAGQQLLLMVGSLVGGGSTRIVTFATVTINKATNTIATFNTARDFLLLEGVQKGATLGWQVILNDGATLS